MNKEFEILSNLNPQQSEAVRYAGGPLLVLAGAGSGKTRIITSRIVHMINQGVSPSAILAVTFTNKAASEMKSRVFEHVQSPVSIGTFHSICLRILRRNAESISRKSDFTIYDDQDQLAVIKTCMKELNINPKEVHPKHIREGISRCKDQLQFAGDLEDKYVEYADQMLNTIYKLYEEKLQKFNGLDFGDLIAKTVRLFSRRSDILEYYQKRFRYILIDEYQDTNYAQYMWIKLLAQKYNDITVVGDPDQSIYEWRGADVENIMKFESEFKGTKTIRLEQNYRSTNTILKAANAVISNNFHRQPKELWSDKGDGHLVEVCDHEDEREEAQYFVQQTLKLRKQGHALNDMACFYRTHAQSRVFEEELMRQNIPYKIVGGVKFYARREIKDLMAYLRVVHNPDDEVSVLRIINIPKRGIGKTSLEKISKVSRDQNISFFTAMTYYMETAKVSTKLRNGLTQFVQMIQKFRQATYNINLSQLLTMIMDETGYVTELKSENTVEAKVRMDNIREFRGAIVEFQESLDEGITGPEALRTYLELISLQTSIDNWDTTEQVLTLMTLHSAKGLEFPIVFMPGMEEGLLPHMNALQASSKEIEEERRLCYVGFTRAQEKLFLSYANYRTLFGYERTQTPSRFLNEIPEHLLTCAMNDCGIGL